MSLGELLKEEMEKQGLTQQQVVDKTGVSRATLNNMLHGYKDTRGYSVDTLVNLSEGLNIPLHRIIAALGLDISNSAMVQEELVLTRVQATFPEFVQIAEYYKDLDLNNRRAALAVLIALLETQTDRTVEEPRQASE